MRKHNAKRMKEILTLSTGIIIGLALAGPVTQAAETWLKAIPSPQAIYIDGVQVELEAYSIHGNNFVKLRDIGEAVDFDVAYNPTQNAVIVEPGKPYTGEDVTAESTPTPQPPEIVDYAAQANPVVFGGELTQEVYNAIRSTAVNREAILAGIMEPQAIAWSTEARQAVDTVTAAMGNYPAYEAISTMGGRLACNVKYPEAYAQAVTHTQPFIDSLSSMSQQEQVKAIAWYVCDRLTYNTDITSPTKILASDNVFAGNCMSYAQSFIFLCNRANIPCLLVHSETHQWNKVYVDGKWWEVDVTSNDVGDETYHREYATILCAPTNMQGKDYINETPEVTAFVMEILVPGSTK